ncbi:MAG: YtxH domain-containing protein [Cyanobacteria bacterium J06632_22]
MAENSGAGGAFVGGVILGAALGAVAGLLAAPKSGQETRRVLKKSADAVPELVEDLATSLQLQTDRLSETALHNWAGTLERLKHAIAAGQAASKAEYTTYAPAEPVIQDPPAHRE